MTTITAIDYRRTDLRTNVLENPYWITSGLVDATASEDLGAILFSFPTAGQIIFVEQVVCQIVAVCTASTLIDIGSGTLATDAVTTGGDITIVDADEYIKQDDITVGTAGRYASDTAHASDWLTAKIAGSYAAPYIITGAASTVPCVYATVSNTGTISAGTFRVHMLITVVP
jgi:hypothetical protein